MLFNSFNFLIFFTVVCLAYYLIPHRFRYLFLLAVSYFFYMCWNPKYGLLMFISTVITYLSGILISRADKIQQEGRRIRWKKIFVALSFLSNLSILFFFKYFNFAVASLNRVMTHLHMAPLNVSFDVLLPVGISFYTFQALSYTIDVYRGDIYTERNFFKYALFVSFFPQLVAGPIERSKNLLRQISTKHTFNLWNVQSGLTQMLYGYFQKVVISDNVAILVNKVYDNYSSYGSVELILATVFFAIQIYCDFGGYSNIAIGAARVMGFELMENFNTPYFSVSVADFWRRWHISLSTWFRDYLYIPLGGNRKGKIRKYINIMIVFLASGLWHGANWHFVAWGGLNGLYQVVGDMLRPVREKVNQLLGAKKESFSHHFLEMSVTFILINISWVFFRASGIRQAFTILKRMVTCWNPWLLVSNDFYKLGLNNRQFHMVLLAILVLILIDIGKYRKKDWIGRLRKQEVWFQWAVYLVLLFWILIFGSYGPGYDASQFIYFQF